MGVSHSIFIRRQILTLSVLSDNLSLIVQNKNTLTFLGVCACVYILYVRNKVFPLINFQTVDLSKSKQNQA